MPKVWIEISLTTQTHLEQVLRAGCVRTLKHGDRDVWKLEQLQEGKRYTPGATAENESKKRGRPSSARAEDSKNLKKRRKSLLSTRAKKSLTLHPSAVRGALLRRAAELRASRRNDVYEPAVRGPYRDTAWLNVSGEFRPISIDKRDLDKRFARWKVSLSGIKEELEEAETRAAQAEEKQEVLASQLQTSQRFEAALKAKVAALQADLENVVLEQKEECCNVSFKLVDSNEYDPDFELCLMQVLFMTSYSKAWPLVCCVYRSLTGKTITDKPSRSYLQDLMRRADVLTELQICFAFLRSDITDFLRPMTGQLRKGSTSLEPSSASSTPRSARGKFTRLALRRWPTAPP